MTYVFRWIRQTYRAVSDELGSQMPTSGPQGKHSGSSRALHRRECPKDPGETRLQLDGDLVVRIQEHLDVAVERLSTLSFCSLNILDAS